MPKEEIIEQLNLAIDLIKQDGKDWLDDRDIPMLEECVKALSQELTVQDKQAESEKYQKAFDDGYANGYAQARFDYEQEPCEKQIKIGTKVRTTKDKDFACEKVFPVGTIGIVERIDKGGDLPYIIAANNDYFYYSRDMFEIIEDVEPCTDAVSRQYLFDLANKDEAYDYVSAKEIADAPSVNPQPCADVISREDALNGVDAMYNNSWDLRDFRQNVDLMLKELPPVTQKPGKWIDGRCNKCGEKEPLAYCGTQLISVRSKFCHNCGAKMESEGV